MHTQLFSESYDTKYRIIGGLCDELQLILFCQTLNANFSKCVIFGLPFLMILKFSKKKTMIDRLILFVALYSTFIYYLNYIKFAKLNISTLALFLPARSDILSPTQAMPPAELRMPCRGLLQFCGPSKSYLRSQTGPHGI